MKKKAIQGILQVPGRQNCVQTKFVEENVPYKHLKLLLFNLLFLLISCFLSVHRVISPFGGHPVCEVPHMNSYIVFLAPRPSQLVE